MSDTMPIERIARLEDDVKELKEAFPDGVINHRRAHEEMISAATADKTFMRELKLEAAKKGIFLFLITMLGLLVLGAQIKLKQFLGIGG